MSRVHPTMRFKLYRMMRALFHPKIVRSRGNQLMIMNMRVQENSLTHQGVRTHTFTKSKVKLSTNLIMYLTLMPISNRLIRAAPAPSMMLTWLKRKMDLTPTLKLTKGWKSECKSKIKGAWIPKLHKSKFEATRNLRRTTRNQASIKWSCPPMCRTLLIRTLLTLWSPMVPMSRSKTVGGQRTSTSDS